MLAKSKQEISIFQSQITNKNSLQIKKAFMNNIGPTVFKSFIDKRYSDLVQSDFCSIEEMFDYIKAGLNDYSHFIRLSDEIPRVGISINTNTGPSHDDLKKPEKNLKKPVASDNKDDKNEEKYPFPCWNCNGNHKLSKCKEKCRIHKKTDCENLFNCLRQHRNDKREDSEKNKKAFAVCIESNGNKCSNIYDPGASATASHKKELFNSDSIVYNSFDISQLLPRLS